MQKELHLFANTLGLKAFLQKADVTPAEDGPSDEMGAIGIGLFSFCKDSYRVTPHFLERLLLEKALSGQIEPLQSEPLFIASAGYCNRTHSLPMALGLESGAMSGKRSTMARLRHLRTVFSFSKEVALPQGNWELDGESIASVLPGLNRWLLKGLHPSVFRSLAQDAVNYDYFERKGSGAAEKWLKTKGNLFPFQHCKSVHDVFDLVFKGVLGQARLLNPRSLVVFLDSDLLLDAFAALHSWLTSLNHVTVQDADWNFILTAAPNSSRADASDEKEGLLVRLFLEWLSDRSLVFSGVNFPRVAVLCRNSRILEKALLQYSSRRKGSNLFSDINVRL